MPSLNTKQSHFCLINFLSPEVSVFFMFEECFEPQNIHDVVSLLFTKDLRFECSADEENFSYENSFSFLSTNDVDTDNEHSFTSNSNFRTFNHFIQIPNLTFKFSGYYNTNICWQFFVYLGH